MSKSLYKNVEEGFRDTNNVDALMKQFKGQQTWLGGGRASIPLPWLANGSGAEVAEHYFANPHPEAITITAVKFVDAGATNICTVDITNLDTTNSILASAIDLDAATDDTRTAATLSSTAADLIVPSGGLLKITTTTDSAGKCAGGMVEIFYEPNA